MRHGIHHAGAVSIGTTLAPKNTARIRAAAPASPLPR
jgi:hypothetical protein